jgi:hypothetical protein
MVRLDHPTARDVHVDVAEKDVKRWERSGWVKPATSTEKPSRPTPGRASTSTKSAPPETAAHKKE